MEKMSKYDFFPSGRHGIRNWKICRCCECARRLGRGGRAGAGGNSRKGPRGPALPKPPRVPDLACFQSRKNKPPHEAWHFRPLGCEYVGRVPEIPVLISGSSRRGGGGPERMPASPPPQALEGKWGVWSHISRPPQNTHLKTSYFRCNPCSQ